MPEIDFFILIKAQEWTAEERAALDRGDPVVRTIKAADKQELATLGVVRIKGLPPVQMSVFRDSFNQKGGQELQAGGRFSKPASMEDVRSLELDKESIEQLANCIVGKCDLNLSAEMITRFRRLYDQADARESSGVLFKDMIVRLVNDYNDNGDLALGTYDNRRKTVDVEGSHRSLLANTRLIDELAPDLAEYLRRFPGKALAGVESTMHWSVVDFGLKPSITVSHAAAYSQVFGTTENLVVVSKQIYSSRYLDSSLTVTALVPVAGPEGVDSYLIFADRSRSDALEGPLGGFARTAVQREAVQRITKLLDRSHLKLLAGSRISTTAGGAETDQSANSWYSVILRYKIPVIIIIGSVIAAFVFWYSRDRLRK